MAPALSTAEDLSPFYDQRWRLANLYWIQDKDARTCLFVPNDSQMQFLDEIHGRDVIVKARQRGFSTMIDLLILDNVLFNKNYSGAVIAHNLDDAKKLFKTKVLFPYRHLPDQLRTAIHVESESSDSLTFDSAEHGSSIHVSTSARSGTVQFLHVSEMGKIAAKFPDKSKEIITGAFEAVPKSGTIVVESTTEGAWGDFHKMAMTARKKQEAGTQLTALDFKLHFHPWWMDEEYELPPEQVIVDEDMAEYFESLLTKHGIFLTEGQKAWYVKKHETLGDDMKREYPSTFDESFEVAIAGAYYAKQMSKMRLERRLGRVPYDPNYPVFSGWDLGMNDTTVIWFAQLINGHDFRLIDYYEASGEGIDHEVRICLSKGYTYRHHFMPHDARRRAKNSEIAGETVDQTARRLGLYPLSTIERTASMEVIVRREINIVRRALSTAVIDAKKCEKGVKALDAYQKEWDERLAAFRRTPLHNWASNGADALRYLVIGLARMGDLNDFSQFEDELEAEPTY